MWVDDGAEDFRNRFPRLFEESYVDYAEARITYVPGAAHFITDDAPEAVAGLALDWFDRAG